MMLHELKPAQPKKKVKRLGKGVGTGKGKTSGRGHKGQNSRSGGGTRPGFEGGQMPIHRRLPKKGFSNNFKKKIQTIHLGALSKFQEDDVIDIKSLYQAKIIKGRCDNVKILGNGKINFPVTIKSLLVTDGARKRIEDAGGRIES